MRTMATGNHNYKLYVKLSEIQLLYINNLFFFVRIIGEWNNSPKIVVEAGNLNLFRSRIKHCFQVFQKKTLFSSVGKLTVSNVEEDSVFTQYLFHSMSSNLLSNEDLKYETSKE